MKAKKVYEEDSKGVIKKKGSEAIKEEIQEDPVAKKHHIHKKDMFEQAEKMIDMVNHAFTKK